MADAYLRTLLVHLLTRANDRTRIVIAMHDVDRLFGGQLNPSLQSAFADRLHVAALLEDAIEHLEFEAELIEAERANSGLTSLRCATTTYWFATPGADSDVVHQTLQRWHGLNLVALMSGSWPYGPTLDRTSQVAALEPEHATLTPLTSSHALRQ